MRGTVVGVLLLVDAANVVGSRPDGWWRDRAGAAAGLVERLSALPGAEVAGERVDEVVVVLEGKARSGHPPTRSGPVRVVHAAGSGDDALAALCAPGAVLVTADRELQGRARSAGADVLAPSRLLEVLDSRQGGREP